MTPVNWHAQRGTTLLLGMILLAAFSLAVTNAFSDNQWQLRLSKNQSSEQRAVQAASSALEWAEAWLMSLPGESRAAVCTGTCDVDDIILGAGLGPTQPEQLRESWWLEHGFPDGFEPLSGVMLATRQLTGSPAGRWLVEEVHFNPDNPLTGDPAISYFRILARAPRAPQGTPVLLESIIARPWGATDWSDALPGNSNPFCHQSGSPDHCGRLAWQRRQ